MRKASHLVAAFIFAMALVLVSPAAFCNMTPAPETNSASKNQGEQGYFAAELSATKVPTGGTAAWKEEFERICAQTEIATSLSAEQLYQLIKDSDVLLEKLHGVEDPWAKVYIFRLKNCQKFFNFALEWQEKERQDSKP